MGYSIGLRRVLDKGLGKRVCGSVRALGIAK